MSKFTHAQCTDCWNERNPDKQTSRVLGSDTEACCYCGMATKAGIYVRDDPKNTNCKEGAHDG